MIRTINKARLGVCVMLAGASVLGCTAAPDMAAVDAQRAKPVQRFDTVQALAANEQTVVASSQAGAVLVSSDHGTTWRREALGPASLIGLTVCPDGSFLGIDFYRKVWTAAPDGSNWTSASFDKPRVPLTVACDPQGGWWVGGTRSIIAHSRDRGANWTVSDMGEDYQITTLQFIDASHAVATGEFGMVLVSADAGASWAAAAPMPDEFYPYATLFVSASEGYVSGIAGQMLRTLDGGQHWARLENAAGVPVYRLFMHEGVPYGVGAEGTVLRLEGDVWRAVAYPDPLPVFFAAGASLPGQSAILAGGPGGLLRVIGTRTASGS
ncbi:glycosyl hydrolase [Azoarcus sp. L1K30]|uniref:WD40/YVTN/BNR-like repeat-containing protein n=1 Tax=Azoarcus sp. L1K30 TaxID=2820277 RepID=UPI0032C23BB7